MGDSVLGSYVIDPFTAGNKSWKMEAGVPSFFVWAPRTVIFQLSGFYCIFGRYHRGGLPRRERKS